ncbi:MAG: hypothetical protein ACRBBP_05975, partial [Bdellovibrionales bacterium]
NKIKKHGYPTKEEMREAAEEEGED